MKPFLFKLVASVLAAFSLSLISASAHAEGVTFEELEAALSKSFTIEKVATDGGTKFLMVQGKNHIIAAVLINGANQSRAPGIAYFSILDNTADVSFMHRFNREFFYSKLGQTKSGKGVLTLEVFAEGGVNEESIRLNAAMLMVRLTDYQKETNKTIAALPSGSGNSTARLNARGAMQQEAFAPYERRLVRRSFSADRSLMKSYFDQAQSLQ